ncbi:MAG: plastocyanin [Candidatus Peribacteria bacterium]|nr:plastocyanin [Candidatus Peribacteria bacterium]
MSVSIQNFSFQPQTITVRRGSTLTWTNQDSASHTVTRDASDGPMSPTLSSGQSYSYTFNSTGTFTYHCSIHPDMHGTVVVTD